MSGMSTRRLERLFRALFETLSPSGIIWSFRAAKAATVDADGYERD